MNESSMIAGSSSTTVSPSRKRSACAAISSREWISDFEAPLFVYSRIALELSGASSLMTFIKGFFRAILLSSDR